MLAKKQLALSCDEFVMRLSSLINTAHQQSQVYTAGDPATVFLAKAQETALLKKYIFQNIDEESMQLQAFLTFEEVNKRMEWANTFVYPNPSYLLGKRLPEHIKHLLRAKRLIARTLGEFDEDEFFASCKNSSGTTLGVSYRDSSPEAKFKACTHTTGVDKWFRYYLQYDYQLKRALPSLDGRLSEVRGAKATTVPKDSKKLRMICVEPMLNMFFQQGLMQVLAQRLEAVGLSFTSQQDRNKDLAWYGSLTGDLATIDWSSASDSLSYELVKFLLPRKWFYYLDQFRCKEIEYMGGYTKLHMFSTMGNACTFPLETLVFWALCSSIQDGTDDNFNLSSQPSGVAVFGDDCIVKRNVAEKVMNLLKSFGFMPNADKSFWEGHFRESCGGDFLHGKDVRPYHLTGPATTSKTGLTAWANIIFNRLQNRFIRIEGPLKYIYSYHLVFQELFAFYRSHGLCIHIVPTDFPDDAGLKIGSDCFRYLRYFRVRDLCSQVTTDRHGTRRFSYLRAMYPERRETDQDIRYWMSAKGLASLAPPWYSVKRRQKYVVAKGVSPVFCLNVDGKH